MSFDQLKLDNQLCFPLYAASRLIIRKYQPFLDKLGITYPQYLVLMVLWETDALPVNDIAKKLILNTNTITPLLKRMEKLDIVSRQRSSEDERKVVVKLTLKGHEMEQDASIIPIELGANLTCGNMELKDLHDLKERLQNFIDSIEI
ncbi:MAG: MarR family transcriptional regulator [Marinifilaceae bacterium]|jgi:DNA-binding MarR family transcriptional regulator